MPARVLLAAALLAALGCAPGISARARQGSGLENEPVAGDPPGLPLEDDQQWHLTLFHVHSGEGDWRYRDVKDLPGRTIYDPGNARMAVRLAAARGIKVVVFTDHNSLESRFDPALTAYGRELGVTVLGGSEWSLGGPLALNPGVPLGHAGPHLAMLGYTADSPRAVIAPADTTVRGSAPLLQAAVDTAHARGGTVVLCHPNALNSDYGADTPLGFDLVEVEGPRLDFPWLALSRWQRWLMQGYRLGGIASAEWHVGRLRDEPFRHLNLVRAKHRTPEDLLAGLRAGHVIMVSRARKIPRVLLGADGDEDGSFDDVREGDVLVPPPGMRRAKFQVRVIGASGHTLLLFGARSDRPIHEERFSVPEVVRAFSLALSPDKRTFIRAELWRREERLVLTNPLYFDPAPPGPAPGGDAGPDPALPLDNGAPTNESIRIISVPDPDGGTPP